MSLPVQLAWEFGLTLVGFLRGNRFVLFSGEERLRLEAKARLHRFLRQLQRSQGGGLKQTG